MVWFAGGYAPLFSFPLRFFEVGRRGTVGASAKASGCFSAKRRGSGTMVGSSSPPGNASQPAGVLAEKRPPSAGKMVARVFRPSAVIVVIVRSRQ